MVYTLFYRDSRTHSETSDRRIKQRGNQYMNNKPTIAVIGAGLGGAAAGALLQQAGYPTKVYE